MDELRDFILARAREHWNVHYRIAVEELVKEAGTGVVNINLLRWLAYVYFSHKDYKREWLPPSMKGHSR